jgi:hypothetical protein
MSLLRDHSVSRRDAQDSLSAAVFCFPGICATVSHVLLIIHYSQIFATNVLFALE